MEEQTSDSAMSNSPQQPSQASQVKVLVIDDTKSIVAYIKDSLEMLGYENIVTAYDGVSGLEQFYHERPDCVIVDVKMPGLDGYQVVRSIRGDLSAAHTPIIILSAYEQPDHRLTGLLSGVDEYLPKPCKPQALGDALERVLRISPDERTTRMVKLANGE